MANILVVDDELGIRDLLSEILNDEGHTVELAENRIKVSFPGITAFSHDGANISDELQRQLNAVVESLKGTTYQMVTVLGHTDSSGQLAYNNKLSQQRAEQVMAFLQQQGVAAEQLTAEGRGPSEPMADNKTAQGRAANCRAGVATLDAGGRRR